MPASPPPRPETSQRCPLVHHGRPNLRIFSLASHIIQIRQGADIGAKIPVRNVAGNSGLGEAEQRRKALSIWRTREARLLKQASTPWATLIPSTRSFTKSSRTFL
jgi:hypothetical protein